MSKVPVVKQINAAWTHGAQRDLILHLAAEIEALKLGSIGGVPAKLVVSYEGVPEYGAPHPANEPVPSAMPRATRRRGGEQEDAT